MTSEHEEQSRRRGKGACLKMESDVQRIRALVIGGEMVRTAWLSDEGWPYLGMVKVGENQGREREGELTPFE